MRHVPAFLFTVLILSASCSATETPGDTGNPDAGPADGGGLSMLRTSGTNIVDSTGNAVTLRGVNLGGWMFHETWITSTDYSHAERLLKIATARGWGGQALAAITEAGPDLDHTTCPTLSGDWARRFETAFEALAGKDAIDTLKSEISLTPPLCSDADLGIRSLFFNRFGLSGRDALMDAFEGAWISESDIAWLKSVGFNVVRIPIGYRNITSMTDEELPESLVWNEPALDRIDTLLDWCERYGVYAVIDMQEVPGGQNTYAGMSHLWDNPKMQALTVELWEYLSDRYRNRASVAAYSLMAEPYGAPSTKARDRMYDLLVKAIRARGDNHICVIHDGFFGMMTLPAPSDFGWTGVAYSTHLFEKAKSVEEYEALVSLYDTVWQQAQKNQKVPFYVGSFSTKIDEQWAFDAAGLFVDWFEKRKYSWSLWTYKRLDDPFLENTYGQSWAWGLRSTLVSPFDRPDPYNDDMETLTKKFGAYSGVKLLPNTGLLTAITAKWRQK